MQGIDKYSFALGMALGRYNFAGNSGGELSEIVVRSGTASFIEVPAVGFAGIGKVTVIGDEDLIPANIKYGVEILGVKGAYSPADPKLTAGNATITGNGSHTFYPSGGYAGLSRMTVNVKVPTQLVPQSKSVMPGYNGQVVTPDSGFNALSSVVVAGDTDLIAANIREGVSIFGVTGSYSSGQKFQSKTVTPGRSGKTVTPDVGYNGLSSVYVVGDTDLIAANIREGVSIFGVAGSYSSGQKYQSKSAVPNRSGFTVTADGGYNALASVHVVGDSNLVPGKIADGVTIFGVRGTYVSPMKPITIIPSLDEQYILPADGFYGFSAITVAPAEATGDYNEGFAAGASSRDAEVEALQARIETLTKERDEAYENGYSAGYEAGAADVAASYQDLDEEEF